LGTLRISISQFVPRAQRGEPLRVGRPAGQHGGILKILSRQTSSPSKSRHSPSARAIDKVLPHGDVNVDRPRLKYDAQPLQGGRRLAPDIVPNNANRSRPHGVEARDQRKERRLSRAVQPQQDGKRPIRDRKANSIGGASRPVSMTNLLDLERGHSIFAYCESIATPHGSLPTCTDLITLSDATSTNETSLERPLATTRYFSSGVKSPCQTR
jgi:hypothetical protein